MKTLIFTLVLTLLALSANAGTIMDRIQQDARDRGISIGAPYRHIDHYRESDLYVKYRMMEYLKVLTEIGQQVLDKMDKEECSKTNKDK